MLGRPVLVWIVALPVVVVVIGWLGRAARATVQPERQRVLFQTFLAVETDDGMLIRFDPDETWPEIQRLRAQGRIAAQHGLSVRLRRTVAVEWPVGLVDPIERWTLTVVGSFTEVNARRTEMTPADQDRVFELQRLTQDEVRLVPTAAELFAAGRGSYRRLLPSLFVADLAQLGVYGAIGLWMLAMFRLVAAPDAEVRLSRASRGRCPHCSYDLAGSVPGRCPECGCLPGADELAVLAGCVSMTNP